MEDQQTTLVTPTSLSQENVVSPIPSKDKETSNKIVWIVVITLCLIGMIVTGLWYYRVYIPSTNTTISVPTEQSIITQEIPTQTIPTQGSETKEIALVRALPELKSIEAAIIKNGGKIELVQEPSGVVLYELREEGMTRIDTFIVDATTGTIQIDDLATGKQISVDEWKKTIPSRFP